MDSEEEVVARRRSRRRPGPERRYYSDRKVELVASWDRELSEMDFGESRRKKRGGRRGRASFKENGRRNWTGDIKDEDDPWCQCQSGDDDVDDYDYDANIMENYSSTGRDYVETDTDTDSGDGGSGMSSRGDVTWNAHRKVMDPDDPVVPTGNDPEVYESRPLKSKHNIRWRISELSMILQDNSWAGLALSFESRGSLGRNYNWRISLGKDDDYLYGRVELISPVKYRIPYQMEFQVTNIEGIEQEQDMMPREITSQDDPQAWRICQSSNLSKFNNDDDVLELSVHVHCFGSETTQGFQLQNFPY